MSTLIQDVPRFLSLVRFSHTLFALPFALMAALLVWREYSFSPIHLLGLILGMLFARTTAMAFNRLVDREIDARNPRTAGRHLPAGLLTIRSVSILTILSAICFILSTLLFLPNYWPLRLSIPVLAFLCGYSYSKRVTVLCHYWLAAALMLSPICVWIALTGTVNWIPVSLAGVIFFWVGGFDIIYACQDSEFDRKASLSSIPAWLGNRWGLRVAALSHLVMWFCLVLFWYLASLGTLFGLGIVAVGGLLIYEHSLVRADALERVNQAFFQVNIVISMGLLGLTALELWLQPLS